jgi:ABC-2 type transport system permease protein
VDLYLCARILAVSVIAFASLVLVIATGALVFGVEIIWDRVPAALLVAVVGALCFAALGMMITALFRSAETVQAAASATIMPLAFISDIFVRPNSEASEWIPVIGNLFPLRHFRWPSSMHLTMPTKVAGLRCQTPKALFTLCCRTLV